MHPTQGDHCAIMGRLVLLILLIAAAVLIWKAFGPATWKRNAPVQQRPKGPDDDPDFLWEIEKNSFKKRREAERAAEEEQLRIQRAREKYKNNPPTDDEGSSSSK